MFIAERFDANYPHLKGAFATVIDNRTERAEALIDSFSEPGKPPQIAVSVDMLDTGIDVPEVVNLVFFKPVHAKTKFWQMIGRGTRLRRDLFGPGRDKREFLIFDVCGNFEYFAHAPEAAEGGVAPSLGERLFAARAELILELNRAPELDEASRVLQAATADHLHALVAGMSLDNFLVRPHRRLVERWSARGAWEKPDPHALAEAVQALGALPSSVVDPDVDAKRFDLLVLRTELAVLRGDGALSGLRDRIVEAADALERLANVPVVAAQLPLIRAIQGEEWWSDVTAPLLDEARRKLRSLLKLVPPQARARVYTDLEDVLLGPEEVQVPGVVVGTDMDRFRAKARHFLVQHIDHLAVQRLRRNDPLTPTDLAELERILLEVSPDAQGLVQALKAEGGLGLFVRRLVGLKREAAKQALGDLLARAPLTAAQLEFLNLIVDHLTGEGVMDPSLLYEPPFTDLSPRGASGLFREAEVHVLVRALDEVRARAA